MGHAMIELKLTFKEGGAPDFQSQFERIKERLQQVVETARENHLTSGSHNPTSFPTNGVNLDAVHLDELPSYQASGQDRIAPGPVGPGESLDDGRSSAARQPQPSRAREPEPPSDAPPGYEETQQQSIQVELDRRLSEGF